MTQIRPWRAPLAALIVLAGVTSVSLIAAPKDRTSPTIRIVTPAAGATVNGTALVSGTAADNVAVARVEVSIDNGAFVATSQTTSWSYSWQTTNVGDGSHTITARATDTAGRRTNASVAVTVLNTAQPPPPPSPGTASGMIPAGLPTRLTVGLFEDSGNTWMRDSAVRWDNRYRYITNGWVNNWGWGAADGWFALNFMQESAGQGFAPVLQYYVMNGVSNYNEGAFLATTQNPSKMADYFGQWKILMQRIKEFGKPVIVMVEADGFGFLEQQSGGNSSTYAAVAASGVPELSRLPNTVAGWGMAFLELRRSVGATNAVLAMDISGWGTGKDLLYFSVTDDLSTEVDKAYNFLAPLGLAPNQTNETWDLLSNNPLDRDSDFYTTQGQNRWWDTSDAAPVSSRSFNRYAEWLRLWNIRAAKRWVLWQIPIGNSNHLNVYNNGSPREGYKDNRPEYFFGTNGVTHRQSFADRGVIGLFFGAGAGGMSTYTNDVYTDGQLYMKSRAGAFLNSGGLAIN